MTIARAQTLKLQRTRARNVYLLPLSETASFWEEMSAIREKFRQLQAEIDAYLEKREEERLQKIRRNAETKRSWLRRNGLQREDQTTLGAPKKL